MSQSVKELAKDLKKFKGREISLRAKFILEKNQRMVDLNQM